VRAAIATLVVCIAAPVRAEPRVAAAEAVAEQGEPDEIADIESREANLEAKEPRKGVTLAFVPGVGVMIGGDIGVGRGPALSLRLGHVATRRTVITFELVGTSGLHKEAITGNTLADSNYALFAGAQRYTSRSFWVRGAGGLSVFVEDADARSGAGGKDPIAGIGGLVGAGIDIWRRGYFVFGIESFGMGTISSDGVKVQLGFSVGFAYY
jgi:hypothetical protein